MFRTMFSKQPVRSHAFGLEQGSRVLTHPTCCEGGAKGTVYKANKKGRESDCARLSLVLIGIGIDGLGWLFVDSPSVSSVIFIAIMPFLMAGISC